jgi:hypothetical protein
MEANVSRKKVGREKEEGWGFLHFLDRSHTTLLFSLETHHVCQQTSTFSQGYPAGVLCIYQTALTFLELITFPLGLQGPSGEPIPSAPPSYGMMGTFPLLTSRILLISLLCCSLLFSVSLWIDSFLFYCFAIAWLLFQEGADIASYFTHLRGGSPFTDRWWLALFAPCVFGEVMSSMGFCFFMCKMGITLYNI